MPHYQIDGNDFTVIFDAIEGTAKYGLIYKENIEPDQNTWDVEYGNRTESNKKSSQKSSI